MGPVVRRLIQGAEGNGSYLLHITNAANGAIEGGVDDKEMR